MNTIEFLHGKGLTSWKNLHVLSNDNKIVWLKNLLEEYCEQNSHKHGVSGKQPDYQTIRAAAVKYAEEENPHKDSTDKWYSAKDFTAGAQWALSQVACATAKGGPAED